MLVATSFPGSQVQRLREAEKRDPGNEVATSKVDMADSGASENSSNSGSYFSDSEASIEDESNGRALEHVGEIRPWRFEPPGRNENRAREEAEDQELASKERRLVSALHL